MFPSIIFPISTALQLLGLAIMTGGMLALGAFAAPAVFGAFPREQAGEAMTQVFLRFDILLLACTALVVLGEAGRFFSQSTGLSALVITRLVLILAISAIALFNSLSLNPKINNLIHHPQFKTDIMVIEEFQKAHKLSEQLYKLQLLLGLLAIISTPFIGLSAVGAPSPAD